MNKDNDKKKRRRKTTEGEKKKKGVRTKNKHYKSLHFKFINVYKRNYFSSNNKNKLSFCIFNFNAFKINFCTLFFI